MQTKQEIQKRINHCMKLISETHQQDQNNIFELTHSRMIKYSSHKQIKVSKCPGILLCCIILIIDFTIAKQINPNIDMGAQYHKRYSSVGPKQRQCLIGLQIQSQTKSANSLLYPAATIIELSHKDALKAPQASRWRYCLIKQKQRFSHRQNTHYSHNWEQCHDKCCASTSQGQCYFKASFINNSPVNEFSFSSKARNNYMPTNNDDTNINNVVIDKWRLLQSDSNSNSDGNVANGGQVVLIVITCIFGVPLLLLIIFAIISIVKLCRMRSMENATNIINAQQGIDDVIAEEVHLDQYKMQQMGPYHVNFQQQCPICLDQKVNIRTKCGHFYHPQCIKAWLMRGKIRCPVCNCTRLNPMKLYCNRCSVGVKLVVLDSRTDDKVVDEMAVVECGHCGEEDVSAGLSGTPGRVAEKKGINKNDNQGKKKGDVSAKQKSAHRYRRHQRLSKVSQPRQQINHSSSSSSNQQQLNSIPVRKISEEHNQNQLMQSLALRASTHHFLKQGPHS